MGESVDMEVRELRARVTLLEAQLLAEQVSKQIWMERFLALEKSLVTRRTDPPYVITVKTGGAL